MKAFVHLHVHSFYSILDGQASIKALIDTALKNGMQGLALTDHGAMFGIKDFYNQAKKVKAQGKKDYEALLKEREELIGGGDPACIEEIDKKIEEARRRRDFKAIIGCEVYCARRSRHLKDAKETFSLNGNKSADKSGWHLVLLAKNKVGYQNLIKIVSKGWTEGYYHRPRIDKELLEQYHEGLVVCSACLGGEIPQYIIHGHVDKAEESVLWFKQIFGDDFYLELQRHKTDNPLANREVYEVQQQVNPVLVELGRKHGVKIIATNDVHFAQEKDAEAHDRLICLSTGKDLNDPKRMRYSKQEWLKSTEEMAEIFSDLPEAIDNTLEIYEKIEPYSIDNEPLMPDFVIPSEFEDENAYLRHLTYEGAKKKYGEEHLTEEVRERIDFELATIANMGYPGYFLIVQDFIAAARSIGVLVGPGRGSAAGSAVAYCLGITDIDPIKYDLLFERFLNPDRISMPDIDIDFDDDGRAEVLKWVRNKYGEENVARIVTYGTMAAKSSIKDVARVHNLPLAESDRLSKLVPDKIEGKALKSLAQAVENVPELKAASLSPDPLVSETIRYALELDGTVRNVGVHACGVIIGKTPIDEVVPISIAEDKDTKEKLLVTQYEGSVIEDTGLIKMDFLGLKTLSILKEAIINIKRRHGIDLDIDRIPLDDEKTYRLYQAGKTVGTFQFESAGMQRYLRELQPTVFEDLIAMNALYRPGPMDYIPSFIRRKHGQEPIVYDLPCMERYLKDTYGITVYQEQVMLLSREIAGFTRGESDELRKVMGKKLADKLPPLKAKFLKGGGEKGYPAEVLEKIWKDWVSFASYAFNKSHATCYSWLAYQTAYLKANYPSEYLAGNLSRNLNNMKEISKLMGECASLGIKVLVPDVNESDLKFSVNSKGNIRFGLNAIKKVGAGAVESIIEERNANGLYTDVYDFFMRLNTRVCNSKMVEALIYAGALDSFGIERAVYFAPMSKHNPEDTFLRALMLLSTSAKMQKASQESSLFGAEEETLILSKPEPPILEDAPSLMEILQKEQSYVGYYISSNPLAPYKVLLNHYCNATTEHLLNDEYIVPNKQLILGGFVSQAETRTTKRGALYGRMTIEDSVGSYTINVYGQKFLSLKDYFVSGIPIILWGSMQMPPYRSDGELEFVVERMQLLSDMGEDAFRGITLSIPVGGINSALIEELMDTIKNNPGEAVLSIHVQGETQDSSFTLVSDKCKVAVKPEFVDFCEKFDLAFSTNMEA